MTYKAGAQVSTLALDSGAVGIGTTSPSAELNIETTGGSSVHISRDRSAGAFDDTGWNLGWLAFGGQDSDSGEDNDSAYIQGRIPTTAQGGGAWTSSSHPTEMSFYTTPSGATSTTQRMLISASGNIGIGTDSPDYTLDVEKSVTGDWLARVLNTATASNPSGLLVRVDDADSTGIILGANASGTYRFVVKPDGKVGVGIANPNYDFHVVNTANTSIGLSSTDRNGHGEHWYIKNDAGQFKFISANADYGSSTVRLTIADGGIITTGGHLVVAGAVMPGTTSEVDNQKIFDSSSGSGSNTLYIGNAAIQVSSDKRIKKNINDTKMIALETLKKLRVVDFDWDDPTDTTWNNKMARVKHGGQWSGIIAQEAVEVVPHIINAPRKEETLELDHESENTWQVDYEHLVPTLVKAVQELNSKVEELEKKCNCA